MSRAAVGLADLLTLLHDLQADEREAAFEAAGYLRRPTVAAPAKTDGAGLQDRPSGTPAVAPALPAEPLPEPEQRQVFWRVASIVHNPDAQVTPPAWLSSTPPATMADLETDPALRAAAAPALPLVRPTRFAAFLRRHVARPVPGAALDTERICRAWARGRALARLPRAVKPRWPARLTLVLENTPTMRLFHDDCWPLIDQARALLGHRAQLLLSEGGPRDAFDADSGRSATLRPDGRSLLFIGDAGVLSADAGREADWAQWAARTQAQGGTALRLTPAGRAHALARAASRWPTARLDPEDRLRLHPRAALREAGAAAPGRETEGLRLLLGCVHGNPCILPATLRQLRLQLAAHGWPLSLEHEASLFDHPALKTSGNAAAIRPDQRATVAAAFQALPPSLRLAAVQQQLADLARRSPLIVAEYVGNVLADLPADDSSTRAALEAGREAAEELHRRIAARLAQEQASGADLLARQESSSYLQRYGRRRGGDLGQASLALQTACVLARRDALRRGEQPLPQGVAFSDVAWSLDERASSTNLTAALRVAQTAPAPAGSFSGPTLQLEFGPAADGAAALLNGLPDVHRMAVTELRDPHQAMVLGWSAARRWVAGDRERGSTVLSFLRKNWEYNGKSAANHKPLFPDDLLGHLTDLDRFAGDIDRQLAEIEPLLPISQLPVDARGTMRVQLAADLLKALPEAWRDSQGIAVPSTPETRLIGSDPTQRLGPTWPVRIDAGQLSVIIEPFTKPAWARSLNFEAGQWTAQAPDGRTLVWVPRRRYRLATHSDSSPTWTLSGRWWDARQVADFPSMEGDAIFVAPTWAARHGLDGYGPWAEFDIPTRSRPITQRLRWIPPGEFWMGSPEAEAERIANGDFGETLHRVVLTRGFWLADTACTQALWEAVLGVNPSWCNSYPDNPVECVSWNDILAEFLPALNRLVPGLEAELPSEAQWEYACRAGTQTPFWFGDQITPEQVNYNGNHPYAGAKNGNNRNMTVPVKSLPANGWGLYEMHGNVWEWCEDILGKCPSETAVDPVSPQVGVEGCQRMLRGGGFPDHGRLCRSAARYASGPDERGSSTGFRLARGLGVPPPAGQGAGGAGDQRAEPAKKRRMVTGGVTAAWAGNKSKGVK